MITEKNKLYRFVDDLRTTIFNIPFDQALNAASLCADMDGVQIEYASLNAKGLCGLAMIGKKIDTIILNNRRTSTEQNFDCSHELIHIFRHRDIESHFECFSKVLPQQNSFLEWQANEGAAQLLVPYQDFIPSFLNYLDYKKRYDITFDIIGYLADWYLVTPQIIRNRIVNLSYEIDQYSQGTSLSALKFLSLRQRNKLGVKTSNYLALCDFGFVFGCANS